MRDAADLLAQLDRHRRRRQGSQLDGAARAVHARDHVGHGRLGSDRRHHRRRDRRLPDRTLTPVHGDRDPLHHPGRGGPGARALGVRVDPPAPTARASGDADKVGAPQPLSPFVRHGRSPRRRFRCRLPVPHLPGGPHLGGRGRQPALRGHPSRRQRAGPRAAAVDHRRRRVSRR